MAEKRKNSIMRGTVLGALIVAVFLILGTLWMGRSAKTSTEKAVRTVSLFYLNELAGRREQVVASNLSTQINNIRIAVGMLDEEDIRDLPRLQAYQARMKQLYGLERFAFVAENGDIYTSEGIETDTGAYPFDFRSLTEPEIRVRNLDTDNKKAVIAVPVEDIRFGDTALKVCFTETDMNQMLRGVSMQSNENDSTFCNIYTSDGVSLANMVLGGVAIESDLFAALEKAVFEEGSSQEQLVKDFASGSEGVVSFTYNGISETLYYIPVDGTDWMLTYLIRENMISERIRPVSDRLIRQSILQTILTAAVLMAIFVVMLRQMRQSAQLVLEKETAEAESRVKQQELEQRLALQEELLVQEQQRAQQDNMITALASDYRSVYYVDLDRDRGICYRADPKVRHALREGDHFSFASAFTEYAQQYVTDAYRDSFLDFIRPAAILENLKKQKVISLRYLTARDGQESWEMLRIAGVGEADSADGTETHAVGVGFTDVDAETRESLAKNQALSDALAAAEEASRAKTAFLSNMSHEIRTPMNAIIGLDNIALNDPATPEETKGYLKKIDDSAQHLLTLINDILDMSRIESGRMMLRSEEFSLPRLLEQINTMIGGQCHDKGLAYHCQVKGSPNEWYIGDDMKLRQVLINILGNAVKFTPEGGSVTFDVEKTAHFGGKTTLRFTVADTGIGISQEYLPKIFDAFSQEDSSATNKYGSSGLGMAITKSIVEMMNGTIEVKSEKGAGSVFTVTVTLLDAERKPETGDAGMLQPHDMSVLVVDDDPVACEHARLELEKAGIAAETAQTGAEAVEKVRLRHARRESYNLILVDWKMPEMDGVETTRQIRSVSGEESAIIILTAYRWDDVQEEAEQAGVDSFMSKPLFASHVMDEFNRAFQKKNGSAEAEKQTDLAGRRILLAEDVDINAEIITMVLQMRQIQAERAANGRIAVDMFRAHPAGYYDAILMDMRMPEMDGLTATAAIRAMDHPDARDIPIIALTANAFDEDVQRSLQAGLNAHLSKPVEPDNLFATLEGLIRN